MKFTNRFLAAGVIVLCGALVTPGCGESEPETTEDALDKIGKDLEKAADDAEKKADDMKKKAEEAAEENK